MTHFNLHTFLLSSQMAPVINIGQKPSRKKCNPFHPYSVCKLIGSKVKARSVSQDCEFFSNQVKFFKFTQNDQSRLTPCQSSLPNSAEKYAGFGVYLA